MAMINWSLPAINPELCTACGLCAESCPEHALDMLPQQGPVFTRPQNCTYCMICEDVCPEHAIRCELEIVWGSA